MDTVSDLSVMIVKMIFMQKKKGELTYRMKGDDSHSPQIGHSLSAARFLTRKVIVLSQQFCLSRKS